METTRTFHGAGVSPGIAVGRALLLQAETLPVVPRPIPPERVREEIARLDAARARARGEIENLRDRVREKLGDNYAAILDAQLLILDDPGLAEETATRVAVGRVSAEWALKEAVQTYLERFAEVDDPYLRERVGDLTDVHRRLQRLLRQGDAPEPSDERVLPEGRWIVVAHDLGPSDAALLARDGVVGLVTDTGGPTSHTAILAHGLSIPAVAGLRDLSDRVRPGEELIVDGTAGRVTLFPSSDESARAEEAHVALRRDDDRAPAISETGPARTADGQPVALRANIEFAGELARARRLGAAGIGLYRSEFFFLSLAPRLPTEDEHYRTYRAIVEGAAPHPATIRTLDLGGEKYFQQVLDRREDNPVLGLRGIRFCLQRPEIFRPQLRGLLRAARHGDLRILLPLVVSAEEIRAVRRMVREEADALAAAGTPHRADVPLGAMIEVPAAAAAADVLAREADFLSLGTNDLIQYALAVDRGNAEVSYLYQPHHPGLLRLIRLAAEAAEAAGLPLSVCGEMAGDPASLPFLIGLGLRELSMQPRSLPAIREALAALDSRRAAEKAREAETPEAPEGPAPGEPGRVRSYRIVR